jgi:hypothetical protein
MFQFKKREEIFLINSECPKVPLQKQERVLKFYQKKIIFRHGNNTTESATFKNQEIIATNLSFTIIPKLEDFILENEWKSTISRYIFQG